MYISRFQFGNYKSFLEPGPLGFSQGFNIISGQNNAGKTALLEAIGLTFVGSPHRSLKTVPTRGVVPNQVSWAEVSFTLSPAEVKEMMLMAPGTTYHVAKPIPHISFARKVGCVDDSQESAQRLLEAIFSEKFLTFKIRFEAGLGNAPVARMVEIPSYGLYEARKSQGELNFATFKIDQNGEFTTFGAIFNPSNPYDIGLQLLPSFQRRIYRFSAERLKVGRSAHGTNALLAPDASNLPEVLNVLQSNPSRFRELNQRLSALLPQVKQVTVHPVGPSTDGVGVWCHDPETQREDLAIPLAESGTGIGQVLAMLYVVMSSDRPQTIIIDEPQSFLHPGAIRKLVDFLKSYPQHQFIMATHSATVIAAANPRTITLGTFEDGASAVQQLDVETEKAIQRTLAELGIRLADSFGADNILWVEGRTEEKCFPLIVERLMGRSLQGTQILSIRQTGDLEGRDAKRVFEIYRSLTKGVSLLPPAIAFILDEECRDKDTKRDLYKLSGNLAEFLPRRMYENYLLNAEAMADVANAIEGFRPEPLKVEEVRAWIDSKLSDPDYFCSVGEMSDAGNRIRRVNAGRILEGLFSHFSEGRVSYEKVAHGVALTEWLVENAPGDLEEVCELLTGVLGRGEAESEGKARIGTATAGGSGSR